MVVTEDCMDRNWAEDDEFLMGEAEGKPTFNPPDRRASANMDAGGGPVAVAAAAAAVAARLAADAAAGLVAREPRRVLLAELTAEEAVEEAEEEEEDLCREGRGVR